MRKATKKNSAEEKERLKELESGKRVSGEPDSNLAAVGGGGIAGAAAGAAVGTVVGGPIGGAIGAAAGAVAGAAVADKVQDELDPKLEEVYWQENFKKQPYYKSGDQYEDYLPAYRLGWESAMLTDFADRNFVDVEPELRNYWENQQGVPVPWTAVRRIVRDAFDRVRRQRRL